MSGLETLSLVCSVMQVISFTGEVISTFKAIYRGQSLDPSVTTTAIQLSKSFEVLNQSLEQAPRPLRNKDEVEMVDIAGQCLDAAASLRVELDKICGGGVSGSYRVALAGTARRLLNKGKIEVLEKLLRSHRETLENRLLQRICKQSDAVLFQQDGEFAKLDATLRHFIEALAAGESRVAGLISKESKATKDHVSLQTGQLRDDIYNFLTSESEKTHLALSDVSAHVSSEASQTRHEMSVRINQMATSQSSATEHHQLLRSLQYETMNARRNQVAESYEETFQWIFGSRQDDEHSDAEEDYSEDLSDIEDEASDAWEQFHDDSTKQSLIAEASRSLLRWLRSEGPTLYWISGKAGSGKSTLMKFLVDHPRTRAELGESTILSHFLWTAGQSIDRSIRGITCSLLHQILLDSPELSAAILNQMPSTRLKNFCNDWSVKELNAAVLVSFAASPKPICIFLDGLDEIDPSEGQNKVLDLVDKLCLVPRLRICVSSRPESSFQRHLCQFPTLQLQDLTRQDIKRYTLGILRRCFNPGDPESREFVEAVCEKSNGVFLWVSLAVKSLQKGMGNADTSVELRKRLESLPDDLYQLYDSMWRRLNEDEPIYREDGAKLLNCVLRAHLVYEDSRNWVHNSGVSLFVLMLTLDKPFRHRILRKNYQPSQEEWDSRAKATSKSLVMRCAGLLDIHNSTVQLIHRSAKEFLENTPHGQQILQHDKSTIEDCVSDIVSTDIAIARLRVVPQRHQDSLAIPSYQTIPPDTIVRRLHRLYHQGYMSLPRTLKVMNYAEDLCGTGLWHSWLHLDFLGMAVSDGFVEFVAPALDRFEKSTQNSSVSASYRSFLVTTACVYGSRYRSEILPASEMADTITLLLRKWTDLGHGGFHYSGDEPEDDMVPCTVMMGLCRFAFSGNSPEVPCNSLEQILQRKTGGNLGDVTTFMLYEERLPRHESEADSDFDTNEDTRSDTDLDADVYSLRMHCFDKEVLLSTRSYLLIEANMAYIIGLYQRILEECNLPVEATRSLSDEVATHSVPKMAKVRYLLIGDLYGRSVSEGYGTNPIALASEADSSYLLESLMSFSLVPGSRRCLVIPGLRQKMLEVAVRGKASRGLEFDWDLERSGYVVAKERVKDWPPKP